MRTIEEILNDENIDNAEKQKQISELTNQQVFELNI